ncbi:MAG TPA: adenylate/guanylate cyclase domain-containing protein [Labilithrix sp.]|jgi:class 3 adenylate cyclase
MTFKEEKLVLFVADLAGFARATAALDALGVADFLADWYARCDRVMSAHGGDIVKLMGDACFATFPEDAASRAIDAAVALRGESCALANARGARVDLGANVHLAVVAAGVLDIGGQKRRDVFGSAVNHLFRMGSSPGVRISEPVYRQLESDRRGPWRKEKPPATYTLRNT